MNFIKNMVLCFALFAMIATPAMAETQKQTLNSAEMASIFEGDTNNLTALSDEEMKATQGEWGPFAIGAFVGFTSYALTKFAHGDTFHGDEAAKAALAGAVMAGFPLTPGATLSARIALSSISTSSLHYSRDVYNAQARLGVAPRCTRRMEKRNVCNR